MRYFVWYWLGGKRQRHLKMVNCGKDRMFAVQVFVSCGTAPSYEPWLVCEKI